MAKKEIQLEEAFQRLEKISKEMTASDIELEKSLKLYEEASHLMKSCKAKLENAENRIEILTKNSAGNLELDEDEIPVSGNFMQ